MKNIILIAALIISTVSLYGQRNTVFVEGLGSGFSPVSINYDYHFSSRLSGFGIRAGVAYWDKKLVSPLMANYVIGGRHGLELAAGVITAEENDKFDAAPISSVSYRYTGSRWMFRAGFTQLLEKPDKSSPSHLGFLQYMIPGVSAGIRF